MLSLKDEVKVLLEVSSRDILDFLFRFFPEYKDITERSVTTTDRKLRKRERHRVREISTCKNKEYKKAKSFIWMF